MLRMVLMLSNAPSTTTATATMTMTAIDVRLAWTICSSART